MKNEMESVILEQKENLAMLYDQNPDPKQDELKQNGLKEDAPRQGEPEKRRSGQSEDSSSGDSFSFLKETIKPKPVSREKIFMQLLRMAIYGVIIGMFACCSFFALKPWAEETFREDPQKVTIPEDTEDGAALEADEQTEQEDPKAPVLDGTSYQTMMESLSVTAEEARKGVVSVHAGSTDGANDWMGTDSANPGVTGLIAADNGQELLILADNSICKDADTWEIVLADGSRCAAALKVQDQNRKLAVFSIVRSIIPEETWGKIQVADLGNSNIIAKGDPVIAMGNLFGYDNGLGYGVVSSTALSTTFSDGDCRVISTDIPLEKSGGGVLVNQEGAVVGIVRQGIVQGTTEEGVSVTANALAISDMKSAMELLLNGEKVPYAGIYGVTVTAAAAQQQELPEGLYITAVDADSPAMAAGIQNGDIIQEVDGKPISGFAAYEKAMLECEPGKDVRITGQRRGAAGYVNIQFTLTVGSWE